MPWSPGGGLWLKLSLLRSWSADCFMEALNDAAQMTRQELIDMAVKAGFFCDAKSATQGIHPMLTSLVRSELIRELRQSR